MKTINVPGANSTSYKFEASEAASGALAQQYANALSQAKSAGKLLALRPTENPSGNHSVIEVDLPEKDHIKVLFNPEFRKYVFPSDTFTTHISRPDWHDLTDRATHLLFHGKIESGYAQCFLKANKERQLSILDAGTSENDYILVGPIGGSLSVLSGSCKILLGESTGNWTIAVNAGRVKSEPLKNAKSDLAISGNSGGSFIQLGSGENHITVTGGRNVIGLGTGNNYLMSQGNDTVRGLGLTFDSVGDGWVYHGKKNVEYGRDFVTINGGGGLYDLGENASVVDAAPVGSKIIVEKNSSITGGAGSRVWFDNAGGTGTISGAHGDTISASGNLSVVQGKNLSISVAGALNFLNGTGNTTLAGGENSTIWGAQGLNAKATMKGHTIFSANGRNSTGDQTYDASGSTAKVEYWSGPGKSSFIGGSGDDHFVFGAASEGVSGDTITTVTGKAGANSYGVLSGHIGGNITITDFSESKGDYFFKYNYNPADRAQAVNDLLATATVFGGNTTLQLDGNMRVTFLHVTHLNASAIHVS